MLEADERQEWTHQARKIAEMADILNTELEATLIPRHVTELMLVAWWESSLKPKVEFPDFRSLFSHEDEDDLS